MDNYKYKIGNIVPGKVTGIESYGAFVQLNDGSQGLIHISEISDQFVKNITDYISLNENIQVKIIGYDSFGRYKLSIKDMIYIKSREQNRIVETKHGFSRLGSMLDIWVDKKLKELCEKNEKNQKFC